MFLSLYVRREVRNSGAVPLLTVYRLVRKKRNRGSRNNLKHWRVFVLISYFNLSFLFFVFFHWVVEERNRGSWNNLWKWKICILGAGISNARPVRRKKDLPQSWYTYAVNWLMICSDLITFSRKISQWSFLAGGLVINQDPIYSQPPPAEWRWPI